MHASLRSKQPYVNKRNILAPRYFFIVYNNTVVWHIFRNRDLFQREASRGFNVVKIRPSVALSAPRSTRSTSTGRPHPGPRLWPRQLGSISKTNRVTDDLYRRPTVVNGLSRRLSTVKLSACFA